MNGGTISGNTSVSASQGGGGVSVRGYNDSNLGMFTKTGGTITGYDSDTVNGNVSRDSSGTVLNNRGHAVYAQRGGTNIKRKETTAGPEVNLSYNNAVDPPTWSGDWDY
jgi:hypothetical protein